MGIPCASVVILMAKKGQVAEAAKTDLEKWSRVSCDQLAAAAVDFLWPIHVSKFPLSTDGVNSLEPPAFGEELVKVALAGFEEYVNKTLPLELELDKQFADEFHAADHSRVNLAFRRWQKRA
eukprot:Skav212134  [mRNA]  locus=scaffold1323:200799:203914:- [translate_table: standard]